MLFSKPVQPPAFPFDPLKEINDLHIRHYAEMSVVYQQSIVQVEKLLNVQIVQAEKVQAMIREAVIEQSKIICQALLEQNVSLLNCLMAACKKDAMADAGSMGVVRDNDAVARATLEGVSPAFSPDALEKAMREIADKDMAEQEQRMADAIKGKAFETDM